jgi:hypothetical protein
MRGEGLQAPQDHLGRLRQDHQGRLAPTARCQDQRGRLGQLALLDRPARQAPCQGPGDADFYNVGSIASTPVTTFAVVTRGYLQKSDAGTRTAAVQLKSGGTTVASPTLVLTTSGFLWAWRMDLTDPNTSAAWTAAGVNAVQIGPTTVA